MQGLNSILLALAAIVVASQAATVNIKAVAPYSFTPNVTNASPGDTVMWTTGGNHTVVESDAAKSCTASTKANAFNSKGPISTTNGFSWTVPADAVTGSKVWYYCGVPTHCQNGMTGTINIVASNGTSSGNSTTGGTSGGGNSTDTTPTDGSSGNSTSGGSGSGSGTSGGSSTSSSTSPSATKSAASNAQVINAFVFVFGLLASGLYLTI